jgi:hypothetical protein
MGPGKLLSAQLSTSTYRSRPHAAIVCGGSTRSRRCFNVLEVLRGLGVNFRHGWVDDFKEGVRWREGDQGRPVSQITTDFLW